MYTENIFGVPPSIGYVIVVRSRKYSGTLGVSTSLNIDCKSS